MEEGLKWVLKYKASESSAWVASSHGELSSAKRAAAVLHGMPLGRVIRYDECEGTHQFEIFDPTCELYLWSGFGNGWRLKWKKAT